MKREEPVRWIGVGIDTARYGHRVSFLDDDRKVAASPITVMESRKGYDLLRVSLERLHAKHPQATLQVHIDAAGQYARNLETFLRQLELPLSLSVGQPKRNKDYQQVHFPKQKTDDTESQAMARFAVVEQPSPSAECPPEFYTLREVATRLQSQSRQSTRSINQLHNLMSRVFPELATVAPSLGALWVLNLLEKYPTAEKITRARSTSLVKLPFVSADKAKRVQKVAQQSVGTLHGEIAETLVGELVAEVRRSQKAEKRLLKLLTKAFDALPPGPHRQLESIIGIGKATAAVLVAKVVSIERFATPGKLVNYFGFFPEQSQSGVDRFGRPLPGGRKRLSAKGNDLVRAYLWMAAKSAVVHNPAVRALYHRLRARGSRGDVALGHCVRKLLHLVFAIWTTNKPFDRNHYPWEDKAIENTQSEGASKENAAGLKRDVLPAKKEVAMATATVKTQALSVKRSSPMQRVRPAATRKNGVDYAYVREQMTMQQILEHLGHSQRMHRNGDQLRGPCPVHSSEIDRHRPFSVNTRKNIFRCFHPDCGIQGNALDLWGAIHNLTVYDAALHLAKTFRIALNREEEPVPSC
jgi:transposase